MKSTIDCAIRDANQSYLSRVQEVILRWSDHFTSRLTEKLAQFNPDLQELSTELNVCNAQLGQLEEDLQLMQKNADEISDLFKFDDER